METYKLLATIQDLFIWRVNYKHLPAHHCTLSKSNVSHPEDINNNYTKYTELRVLKKSNQ